MVLSAAMLVSHSGASIAADASGQDVLSSLDLTKPFRTQGNWQFIIKGTGSTEPQTGDGPAPLQFCFVKDGNARCSEAQDNSVQSAGIVHPASREPLIAVVAAQVSYFGNTGGCCDTHIWAYDAGADRFDQVFARGISHNNNGEVRIVMNGPLAGDVVVSIPPDGAPYRYRIAVYRLRAFLYTEILNYEGRSKYDDGNPLPVIDAEMPQILSRLHLWKPGSTLPIPARTRCSRLFMRNQVEWCEK